MKRLKILFCLVLALGAFASCANKSNYSDGASIALYKLSDTKASVLCCWFVEESPEGRCGYVAIDGRFNDMPPEGGGFFESIEELRKAMKRQGILRVYIVPNYGNAVPNGWKIRSLTQDELDQLRKP